MRHEFKRLGLLGCLSLLSLLTIAGEGQPFTLKGKIKGMNKQYVYLSYSNFKTYVRDSALVSKGSFEFKGNIPSPVMAYLYVGNAMMNRDRNNIAELFIEPGSLKVQLEAGKFDEASLTGSKTHIEYTQLRTSQKEEQAKLQPLSAEYDRLNNEYIEKRRANADSATLANYKERLEKIKEDMEPVGEEMSKKELAFIESHPDSHVSAYLLSHQVNRRPYETGLKAFNSLAESVRNGGYGKGVADELEQLKMGSPGATAHVFARKDINGEEFNLADYKGKYVLIDFWASWCVPCRKGNPHLKKVYNQYKKRGFEIVGISDDDGNPQAWRKAVDQDGIGIWKHVLRGLDMNKKLKGEKNPDDLSDYYGISSLPTKILINPQGVIIGRYGSEEEELDAKLAEVMPVKTVMNLSAHITGLKDSVDISYFEGTTRKNAKVAVKDEKFTFSAPIDEPQKIFIGTPQRYMEFFGENGDIQMEGTMDNFYYAKVTGSNSQDEYVRYNASLNVLDSLLMTQYQALHGEKDSRKKREIEIRIDSFRALIGKEQVKYIVKNPSSPISVELVDGKAVMGEYKSVDSLYNLLSAEAKVTNLGKRIAERLEVLKRSSIGTAMKDFTMPSLNGKKVKLSDFKGKYVFVDFWASWCGPCRAENPNVLKAYNKYKNKNFTVLGISLDDKGDKWKEAVIKDKMPWTQVSDLKGFNNEVSSYYGIQAIPTTFLIDPQGKIIAKNLRGEKLHERLAEILQ